MAAPALVLVPPTPRESQALVGTRPSPTSSATTSSAPHTPYTPYLPTAELSQGSGEDFRKSAESIFSIYSMYGRPGSWTAGTPDTSLDVSVALNPAASRHVFPSMNPSSRPGLPASPRPPSKRVDEPVVVSPKPTRTSRPFSVASVAESNRSSGPVYSLDHSEQNGVGFSQPRSGARSATPSQGAPPSQHGAPHTHPPSSYTHDPPPASSAPSTARSSARTERRSSQPRASRLLDLADPRNVPLPPSHPGTPRPPSAISPPPQPTELLSPPRATAFPAARTISNASSIRSIASGPSEGEDTDSFFVRSTYAQLDVCGVKGDGFEEGVERTRARLGSSRTSEQRAIEALGDGSEKTKELSTKEQELLSSLDRYGFFTIPSHDRLVLLSGAALRQPLAKVAATETNSPAQGTTVPRPPGAVTNPKETSRIEKWGRMLQPAMRDQGGNVESWTVAAAKEHKLRSRVYKGIPDRWRSAAWEVLMSQHARTDKRVMDQLIQDYRTALEKPSTFDVQIDLDVPRTISGHVMFRTRYGTGQRSLFHVLHSFSLRCPDCGYVQGMGPIAATLLCYLDPERVYASLVRLHDAYRMHSIFSPGFPGLLESIYVQEKITQEFMPGVYAAFKKNMVSTTSYATKWYITLFSNSVSFQTQLRLWDVFLLEGPDTFVVAALAIVWVYRDQILSTQASFETILSLLSSFFVVEDDDALMSWIGRVLGDKKLRESMARWRAEWQGLVRSGKEGDALL